MQETATGLCELECRYKREKNTFFSILFCSNVSTGTWATVGIVLRAKVQSSQIATIAFGRTTFILKY